MSRQVPGWRPAVLVVEDEALTRLNALDIVEAAGFEAIGASSADEALRALEDRDDIQAVFTDVQMPGSMDGLALIRLVKQRWPEVAAVVTSGKSNLRPHDVPDGTAFFAKPYLAFQVETALRRLIE